MSTVVVVEDVALLKAAGNEDDNSDMLLLLFVVLYKTCAEQCQLVKWKAITVVVGEGNKGENGWKESKRDQGEYVKCRKRPHTKARTTRPLQNKRAC